MSRKIITAGLVVTGLCMSLGVNAAEIIVTAAEDSLMLDGDDTNNPFPGILASELDTPDPGNVWLSLLKFDLSPLTGMTVNSATLELTSIFNHSSSIIE